MQVLAMTWEAAPSGRCSSHPKNYAALKIGISKDI